MSSSGYVAKEAQRVQRYRPSRLNIRAGNLGASIASTGAAMSSLDTIFVSSRVPRVTQPWNGDTNENDLELNLLTDDEQKGATNGLDIVSDDGVPKASRRLSPKDRRAMMLLMCLCESFPSLTPPSHSHIPDL